MVSRCGAINNVKNTATRRCASKIGFDIQVVINNHSFYELEVACVQGRLEAEITRAGGEIAWVRAA